MNNSRGRSPNKTAMDPALALEFAAMTRQKFVNEAIMHGDSEIQQFYSDATVFITGGSGFLGKLLIEKLFRSCDIRKAYILIRSKKEKKGLERLHDIVADSIFDELRKRKPQFANKIIPIEGDVSDIRLGISDQDWSIISQQVDIIFHVAATTKFDEPLQVATLINIRGTREMINLAKSCKKLRALVHVSTAYAHATLDRVDLEVREEFYPSPVSPDAMIQMAEGMDSSTLDAITPELINKWSNTYTFTKAIAEELVHTMANGLPICIVRPSIVLCTYREPVPGWLDMSCAYGASGIVIGIGMGIMHVIYCDRKAMISIVPADNVTNATIASAWETANRFVAGEKETKIYNVVSVARNPVIWGDIDKNAKEFAGKMPTPKAVWLCASIQTNSKYALLILSWFLHFIPGYILDGVRLLLGKERRYTKLYSKIYKMMLSLSDFTRKTWYFTSDNTDNLFNKMSKVDKTIYDIDITRLNWTEYIYLWCMGLRKYILKDGLTDTKYALRKQLFFRIINFLAFSLYAYCLWQFITFSFSVLYFVLF